MSRYLIDVHESDRNWIKKATKELGWKTADIVQLAISKLKAGGWEQLKSEVEEKRMIEELNAIKNQKDLLQKREDALKQKLTVAV